MKVKLCMLINLILCVMVFGLKAESTMTPEEDLVENSVMRFTVSIRTRQACYLYGDNHLCSGCLIKENVVVSAASCFIWPCKGSRRFYRLKAHNLTVIAGPRDRLSYEPGINQVRFVSHLITHHYYKNDANYNIAVLILNIPIEVTEYVRPAYFVDSPSYRSLNYKCQSSVIGRMYYGGPVTSKMVIQNFTIYSDKECSEYFINESIDFPKNVICTRNNGYCRGDTGGPLLCTGGLDYLHGMIIPQFKCNPKYPTVYIELNKYYRWIMYILRPHNDASGQQLLNLEDTEFGQEPFFRDQNGSTRVLSIFFNLCMCIVCFFI